MTEIGAQGFEDPTFTSYTLDGDPARLEEVAAQLRGLCEAAGVTLHRVTMTEEIADEIERRKKPNDGYCWIKESEFHAWVTVDGSVPYEGGLATRIFRVICDYERTVRAQSKNAPIRSFVTPRKGGKKNRQIRLDCIEEALVNQDEIKGLGGRSAAAFEEFLRSRYYDDLRRITWN